MMNIGVVRLLNQGIEGEKFAHPHEAVRWLGALQAQDYGQALWAIGLRTRGCSLAQVEQAVAEGRILRTWPLRGTLHFVAAEDVKWMLSLTAERVLASSQHRRKQLELDEETLRRCEKLIYDALQGSRRLARPEVMQLFERQGIRTAQQRGYHILFNLALKGLICIGPLEGRQQTYVLLDEWAPQAVTLEREAALAEVARRYFTSRGPALLSDFAGWMGLTSGEARTGTAMLEKVQIGGVEYLLGAQSKEGSSLQSHLLPGFDEFLLGYKKREAVLAAEDAPKVIPGKNGVFQPVMVAGGQVVGIWKRTVKKKAVEIRLLPFDVRDDLEQFSRPAQAYADFVELPLTLSAG